MARLVVWALMPAVAAAVTGIYIWACWYAPRGEGKSCDALFVG